MSSSDGRADSSLFDRDNIGGAVGRTVAVRAGWGEKSIDLIDGPNAVFILLE